MKLDELDRIQDADAKVAFAKNTSNKKISLPWIAIYMVISISFPAAVGIWILFGFM